MSFDATLYLREDATEPTKVHCMHACMKLKSLSQGNKVCESRDNSLINKLGFLNEKK